MILKEAASVAYALYMCEEVTLGLHTNNLELVEKDGYIYFKIDDKNMIDRAMEYRSKAVTNEPIVLDVVRFNHIFGMLKRACRDRRVEMGI